MPSLSLLLLPGHSCPLSMNPLAHITSSTFLSASCSLLKPPSDPLSCSLRPFLPSLLLTLLSSNLSPQDTFSPLLPMLPFGPVGRDESWCLGAVIHCCWRGSLPPRHKLCPQHRAWAGESCTRLSGGDGADGSHAHALERMVWSGVSVRMACVRTCQSKCSQHEFKRHKETVQL